MVSSIAKLFSMLGALSLVGVTAFLLVFVMNVLVPSETELMGPYLGPIWLPIGIALLGIILCSWGAYSLFSLLQPVKKQKTGSKSED